MQNGLLKLIFILLLAPMFGQQSDLVQLDDQPCTHEIPSNALENGLLSPSEGTQIVANDILVAPGDTFTINQVIVTFFTETIILDADIRYYADDNGLPGTLLNTMTDVIPTTVFDVGSFGIFAYRAIIDVPNFDFVGQAGTETRYWISVTVSNTAGNDQAWWETSTAGLIGQPVAVEDGTGWLLHDPGTGQTVDGVYEFIGECVLGVEDISEFTFKVAPNPFTNRFSIDLPSVGNLQIMNAHGTLLYDKAHDEGIQEISLLNLRSGLYFAQFITENGRSTKKIIKE